MRVRDALGPLFTDEDFTSGEFEGMYSSLGQPGLSPAFLLVVTILQFRHNLADREVAQAVADRISWKYALGLGLDYAGFDFSALSEFRSRLAQEGRADRLLSLMVERLKEAGLVKAGGRQRTDSTHVIACVRRLNRIESLGEGLRAALEEIARTSPGFIVPLLRPGWDERYGRKVETSRLLRRKNASADKLVERIGVDGLSLLDAIDADPTAAWMNQLPQVTFLRTLWDQHFQRTAAGRLRYKDVKELPPASERLHSPYDPDAPYSTKGDTEWVGSKAHLSESCDEDLPHLVTDVHTTGATDPDVTTTTVIQDRLIARGLAPGEHLMDAGYPSAEAIAASAQRGISLIAPVIVSTGRNARAGTFTPADFTVDWDAGTARCPAGALSRSMKEDDRGLIRFAFSRNDCGPCPVRDRCTRSKNGAARNIAVHPQPVHEARTRALQAQGTDEWLATYNARAGIEGTISQAVRGPGLRRSRYRGLPKVHLQNVLTGLALNLTRLGAYFNPTATPTTRPSRIRELCTAYDLTAA